MSFTKSQRFFSFLWPVLLFQDNHQENLELHLVKGRLRLQVDNAIYSFDDLYHVFQKAFAKIDLSLVGPKALVLGYGLGSIPYMLEQQYSKGFQYTGVEQNPTIMMLAQKYSNPRFVSKIGLLHIDAQVFMKKNRQKFDLICVDVFNGDQVPAFAKTDEFIEQLKQSLAPKNGVILFNYLKGDVDDFEKLQQRFLAVFPKGQCLDLDTNYVLVG